MLRWFVITGWCVASEVTPEKLHVVVVAVADVAGNIKVVTADVRRGVEQVHEITAADDGADDVFLRNSHFTQCLRTGIGERRNGCPRLL